MTAPKVNFLVIGAQKAGTTALDHYLRQHPAIGMAKRKEVHFFDNEDAFAHGKPDYGLYEREFDFSSERTAYGESTPIYLYWEASCERIRAYNPLMKLIAVLRDPVERAYSQWNMEFNRGDEHRDFRTAVFAELELRERKSSSQHRVVSYLGRGFYSEQIERYQRAFDPHQLLWIKYDDLKADPQAQLLRIFDHLLVDTRVFQFTAAELNPTDYRSALEPETARELRALFEPDIRKVEGLLGWDLAPWRTV